jgi:hypothetical protein
MLGLALSDPSHIDREYPDIIIFRIDCMTEISLHYRQQLEFVDAEIY